MSRIFKMEVIPSSTAYVNGLKKIRDQINDTQMRLLVSLYSAPDRTATELANFAEVVGGYPSVNAQYGRLGRMFCEATKFDPDVRPEGTFRWWAVWSLGYSVKGRGFIWKMLPEVAEALEMLGWVIPQRVDMAEEVDEKVTYIEGAVCKVTINAYERSPEARKKCIEWYGATCSVCGVSLDELYGDVARGLIHVHHICPLASIGSKYKVDPIKDLRPVCPNCHAVVHRRTPPYTVDEVKSFMRSV